MSVSGQMLSSLREMSLFISDILISITGPRTNVLLQKVSRRHGTYPRARGRRVESHRSPNPYHSVSSGFRTHVGPLSVLQFPSQLSVVPVTRRGSVSVVVTVVGRGPSSPKVVSLLSVPEARSAEPIGL